MVRYTLKHCWHGFAVIVIIIALLITAGRLLVPLLDDYRQELADNLSEELGQPLTIGSFSARWHGLGPWLLIRDIALHSQRPGVAQEAPSLAYIEEVEIGINLWQSMTNGQLTFNQLHLSGMQLRLRRQADGSIHLQGLKASGNSNPVSRNEAIVGWLLSQGRIFIDNSRISWQDVAHPKQEMLFRQLRFDIRNEGDRHQISISGALPNWLGKRLNMAIDIDGNPLSKDWHARSYLEGKGLSLPAWIGERKLASLVLSEAIADVQLWAEWQGPKQQSLAANLTLANGRIDEINDDSNDAAQPYRFTSLQGRFLWQRDNDGWSASIPALIIEKDGRKQKSKGLQIRQNQPAGSLEVYAERLALSDIGQLLSMGTLLEPKLQDYFARALPSGRIEQLHLAQTPKAANATTVSAEIIGLSLQAVDNIPGIQNLSALLVSDITNGHLRLHSPNSHFLLPTLFRDSLSTEQLDGDLFWRQDEQGLRIAINDLHAANEDIQTSVDAGLQLPNDGSSPFLYLYGRYRGNGVAHTSRYLPTGIMPAAVVKWLDQAIQGGRVTAGDIRVHGPLRHFPFSGGNGLFKVAFHLSNGQLAFYPGWPQLAGIESDITFLGNTMTIAASAGHSNALQLKHVQADIPLLAAADSHLELHGLAHGPAQSVLNYLASSPLHNLLGEYGQRMRAKGRSDLVLDLNIPFHSGQTAVNGALTFHDSELDIADKAFIVKKINGQLNFSEKTLSAEGIRAELLGLASTLSIARLDTKKQPFTRIKAHGQIDSTSIERIFSTPPLPWLKGKSNWLATLDLPDPGQNETAPQLSIRSHLQGLEIALPAPLQKDKQRAKNFTASLALPITAGNQVALKLGQSLHGLLELDGQLRPERVDIHWGDGKPRLPRKPGLRLSGQLPELAIRPWQAFIRQQAPSSSNATIELNEIDIHVGQLDLGNMTLSALGIDGKKDPTHWLFKLDSDDITGNIDWPLTSKRPLQMNFNRLHLPKTNAASPSATDWHPAELPAIKISSQSFSLGEQTFGHIEILANKENNGLHFSRLDIINQETVLKGHGDWLETKDKQSSSFNFRIETTDLGGTLDRFGYAGTISQGKGNINLSLRWPDSPDGFSWQQTDGEASLLIEKGRLLDVEPGAGRIFGLLSLNALPRRLSMDFSDVFRSGFAFDRLEGDFRIQSGKARTDNLYLEGPAARIEVKGTTHLAARLYDQEITVSPHFGASLPVAGALAGGPVVGAAVLLAEKIFSHDIAKLTRVKYRVTGSWNEPEINVINKKQ